MYGDCWLEILTEMSLLIMILDKKVIFNLSVIISYVLNLDTN